MPRITKPYTAKSRPIIFNAEMVRAILDGRKTQTRRVIKAEWCRYGKPGDFLWVRETWNYGREGGIIYRADEMEPCRRWKPSIYMFRKDSRISLRIVEIRVERVQEISFDDVLAEGISQYTRAMGVLSDNPPDHRWKFIELWDSINAKKGYGWDENSWVWVIKFERIENE